MNRITIELTEPVLPANALLLFASVVEGAVAQRYSGAAASVAFESPRRAEFGDFATNVAFSLAKVAKRPPQDVATQLVADVRTLMPMIDALFPGIDPVAGFINLRLAPGIWQNVVAKILREGARFGEFPRNGK
ncbi:MAG: hypothetical protein JO160_05515, partial [Candidatus Eremiobacteraeota bacterium]|nr:hypothetical protein [Candidatus Eremiobacteraeota bacterium]